MFIYTRTNSNNKDFIHLVKLLDKELAIRDGSDAKFYAQYNKIETINHVILALSKKVIACGALKEFGNDTMEIKRMFVLPEFRGTGIGKAILKELEKWAREMNYMNCVLETGKRQPEAMQLYKSSGYNIIPNYGQYIGNENSVCFSKPL